jgi:hypothetical protein
MTSEWLKVMLDEIARKKAEAAQARDEQERRAAERAAEEHQRADRSAPTGVVQSDQFDPRKKNGDAA